MNYNDLKDQELFVEANAIRFYLRPEGWVNRGEVGQHKEVVAHKQLFTPETDHSLTNSELPPVRRQRTWIEWVRSI